MRLSRQLFALVLLKTNKRKYTKNTKSNPIYSIYLQTQEKTKHAKNPQSLNLHQKRGVTRGWLPETAGAGSPGLNGSGNVATVPSISDGE